MDPFGSDFGGLGELFNRLSGNSFRNNFQEDSSSGALETVTLKEGTYVIFDFSNKTVHDVSIQNRIEEDDYGREINLHQLMLLITFKNGTTAKYVLPKKFKIKKNTLEWTNKNGILEVFFKR